MSDEVVNDQEEQGSTDEEAPEEVATKRQITLAVPPIEQLLILVGGGAMVVSGLLSWIKIAPDAFPNFAGIGAGGGGVGLVVALVGVALLSKRPQIDTAKGVALGAFVASLLTVLKLVDEAQYGMGAGPWVAMVGSALALAGVAAGVLDPSRRPGRQVNNAAVAALGAVLAVVASFWMDWPASIFGSGNGGPFISGLDDDVLTGYPVLILSGLVLLLLLGTLAPAAPSTQGANMAMHIRVMGIAVATLAAADIAGGLMTTVLIGSGPILALIGAVAITRSIGSADGAGAETADAEAA